MRPRRRASRQRPGSHRAATPAHLGWGFEIYLRSRRCQPACVLIIGVVVLQLTARRSLCCSGTPSVTEHYLVALSPAAVVVLIGATFAPALSEWEDMEPRLMRWLRGTHIVLAAVCCVAGAVPVEGLAEDSGWITRNALLLLGLSLLWTVALGPHLNWIAPVVLVGGCYLFGQGQLGSSAPASWAILLRPASTAIQVLSILAAAAGASSFILRGPRRSHVPDVV